ncbi:tetratricopeptide repeat protein [Flavobacterium aciduliphilum]|uniref:Tetratricopeptide repeat protein n=1 Tax=Flavobacterium aciduliphilum TaxID=1101402 RepID=A0A328YH60_9FLAO|nr:tetratricopeptide repeat protein [Flavobacterium aciduliphilum]RAR71322.1 tetratricopeptide repeat protein [Flavobacterium aciduliphilum]
MKNYFYILFLMVQVALAQDAFKEGNQNYQNEHYQEAITNYESILASGKQAPEVYFNLGNCYYKLHKIAPSIYNYEKALVLHPNDAEIQTNLDFARKMTIDDIKIVPKVGFAKLLEDITSTYHYDGWAWIAIILAFVFLGFFAGYYYANATQIKRVFFSGMFVVLFMIIWSLFAALYEKNRIAEDRPAIVFADVAPVRGEPKISAPESIILHEGTKVYVLEQIANWKKVQLTDESTGWIQEDAIKELK